MRARFVLVVGAVLAVAGLTGCNNYNQVNQGWQGPTSPAESGQHGASADQVALSEQPSLEAGATAMPITEEYTNGNYDPTMEGSGNIAAQGNYAKAEQQRQNR
ncbi:MAG: hypothetical protein JO022_02020 [Acidobacteriaceae bacterium]|nr:hypothetical protein [Acidobacteriaceae bacterium]